MASSTIPASTPAALAAAQPARHLTLEQRAQILNIVGTDLNAAAEVLLAVAGIVSRVDPDFVSSQDLAESIKGPVSALKARARTLAA